MSQPPKARWVARADRLCTQANDILLAFALLLAVVVVSGQQHPRGFGDIVAHLDWLSPPMDPRTGILVENAIAGVLEPMQVPRAGSRAPTRATGLATEN